MVTFSSISIAKQILYLLIFLIFFIIIEIFFAFHLKTWSRNFRYIKMEIHRSSNEAELKHWHRELRVLYWSLIPGLTVSRIRKIMRLLKKRKK